MSMEVEEMRLFVCAVQAGSLSAAARRMGFSAAAASKRLARLETGLGVRLLQRTSRTLSLTADGKMFYERCLPILDEMEATRRLMSSGREEIQGLLRVTATTSLGRRWVGPVVSAFSAEHPGVTIKLLLTERLVDLVDEGFDCAVRVGSIADSRLVARTLARSRRVVCASPQYLERHGRPENPQDLRTHNCLVLTTADGVLHADWLFSGSDGQAVKVRVGGRLVTDNGQQVHDWAVAGHGIARRSWWDVATDLSEGRLVEVLEPWSRIDAPISVIYPSRRLLPTRTRAFIDALVSHFSQAQAQA
jgi:DNA-binding transcriptional LysR family regulator